MKETCHLCLSSKEEVLFRTKEDYNWGFNCLALALYKTDSALLADSFMSNHLHEIVQTAEPDRLMKLWRMSYTRHFNKKYHRRGQLGETEHFATSVEGVYHLLAALSYVFRNALHHGVTQTPFAYPHTSANAIFRDELGKTAAVQLLQPKSYHNHVARNAEIPSHYKMNMDGLFLRENVVAVKQVELIYVTPRNFLYYMNRITDEHWIEEQKKDNNGMPPVTLENMEKGVSLTPVAAMLTNEKGRANYNRITDMQLCEEIDRMVIDKFRHPSIYEMPMSEKNELMHILRERYRIGNEQLRRCLAMDY